MVTNDLGACEWFVWDLRRSGLIDRGQLDQAVGEFLKKNPRAEAPALAEYLVQTGTLTQFQAERVLGQKSAGLVLGPYVLVDAIGQGSMGQVYRASSKNDAGLYAVKVLPRRSMWNVRIARRQVRTFETLQHPAVVPFVDVGTAGGLHYLVWPLAEGTTLEALVNEAGKLPADQTARIGIQLAQGLALCHQSDVFHGLLKPSNVMIGADNQARILDYGIGSLLAENDGESLVDTMSTANTLTSGLDCASPESIMDPTKRTPAGDQYSLGCTLYFCLTGRVPYPEGSAVEKMMAHQMKRPEPIQNFAPDVPEGMSEVVLKLMAIKPEDRYVTMDEAADALKPFLGNLTLAATASSLRPTSARGPGGSGVRLAPGSATKPNASGNRGSMMGGMGVPDRSSFRSAPEPTAPPADAPQPATPKSSMTWIDGAVPEDEKPPMIGTVGAVGLTALVMMLLYLGSKFGPGLLEKLKGMTGQ